MAGAIHNTKLKQNQEDPSKFYYHFLYKAVIVAIFLVILPFFPSQAPEFINQSLLTRIWELLHLLFVGIAISYGLFSRRNDETEKENINSKLDNAHSVVSRFLHVSSFFDDETENPSDSDHETQLQTWKIQHHRNKPTLVVAPQHSNFDQQSATTSRIGEKPLLLPVRSLKSRVSESGDVSNTASVFLNRPNSISVTKRFSSNSNKGRNGEQEGFGSPKVEDKKKENIVLPSPVPWRSSLLMDQESEFSTKMESRSFKSQKSRSSRPSFVSSSTKELSPSPSFSSESLAKNAEDLMREKGFYKPSPPPPPPPPPIFQKSISMKPRSRTSSFNKGASFDKELKRSFTSERNDLKRWGSGNKLMSRVDSETELKPKGYVENFSMVKSVRTIRAEEHFMKEEEETEEEGRKGRIGKSTNEDEEHFMEEPKRKTLGYEYDHMSSFRTEKLMGHAPSVTLVSEIDSVEFSEEEKESFVDKVIVESDEDTETEDEVQKENGESPPPHGESSKTSSCNGDEGPDVDKKADEFIAKFREQIRLQRIDSIKRSARVTATNYSR